MWKIVKKSLDKIELNRKKFRLWMKWEFKIDFTNDSFWPYNFVYWREDCYFNDGLEDRWTKIFPIRNKKFDNTEIFLETDDIVIAVWERWGLLWSEKEFIDIINIKTEKKYRLFTKEVNLIFNSEDKVIINAEDEWSFKTIVLDFLTMEKIDETLEELNAFFKVVYNSLTGEWFALDFSPANLKDDEELKYKSWFFILQKINVEGKPESFNRTKFTVSTDSWNIDVWDKSII